MGRASSENSCYILQVEFKVKYYFVLEDMQTRCKGQCTAELTLSPHLCVKLLITVSNNSCWNFAISGEMGNSVPHKQPLLFPFQHPGFLFQFLNSLMGSCNYSKYFSIFLCFLLQNYPIKHPLALNLPLIFICYSSSTETPKQESGN